MVRETLVIDDTSCTNYFAQALVVILAVDEHSISQLVAFAFIADRSVPAFEGFFSWVAERIGADQSTSDDPVPRSLIIDRCHSQCRALERVFKDSRRIFCAKHLAANIFKRLPKDSAVAKNFWPMIKGGFSEWEYESLIHQELADDPPKKIKEFLSTMLRIKESYFPSYTQPYSPEDVSSRAEGFFGNLKKDGSHKLDTLPNVASRVRGLGITAMLHADNIEVQPLPLTVMSWDDQKSIGNLAQTVIAQAVQQAQSMMNDPLTLDSRLDRAGSFPMCCPDAMKYQIACPHLICRRMIEVGLEQPLMSIKDIPERWRRQDIHAARPAEHTRVEVTRAPPDQDVGPRTFSQFSARYELLFSEAHRVEALRDLLIQTADAGDRILRPQQPGGSSSSHTRRTIPPGMLQDPPMLRYPGARATHPANESDLAGFPAKPGPASQTRAIHCGLCGKTGHNQRSCPQKRKENPVNQSEGEFTWN
jgi:hypothetical protein